ncbi:hypothetical protein FHW69_001627 [Luteibacter sp. Sphag1AF]|uniref:hypothetical protein n=1 Tax=Luteibacter sp. Sphag1AF TaxID=2587031 RepID=UPI00161CE9F7|nr:hypothetical protein [Luteibacter sp. Sphag1AF]MBB3227026.1 hypothetical protein [Luteibacter sp. Sphag1AF]
MLASLLFPYDDDAPELMDTWLGELEQEGCIARYAAEGSTYIQILNWLNHQKIDKPSQSKIPAFDESSRILANVRERSSEEGKGREGKGEERKGINTLSPGDDLSESGKADQIPYTEILDAYHEHLPMLPGVRTFSDARRRKLRARWTESKERQSVEYWQEFFAYAALSDFLTGRNNAWTGCDFEWLIESANHIKVSEGKYENKVAT